MSGRPPPLNNSSPQRVRWRGWYLHLLTWAFTLFNQVRVAAYVPTVWAIHQIGNSTQQSLWTWLTWLGPTPRWQPGYMSTKDSGRTKRWQSLGNAAMRLLTTVITVVYRECRAALL